MAAKLGIFDTFKTKKEELTGEAQRQRAIIVCLATENNPAQMTRTALAQRIAQENGTVWKNIYSGIFRDLDEILIPLNIVEEAGRLPLRRGPRALQEKGIPYYHLTEKGLLVSLSLDEIIGREQILERFFAGMKNADAEFLDQIRTLSKFAPRFVYLLFKSYVRAYCDGGQEILPLDKARFLAASDETILIQKEFLESYTSMPKAEKEKTLKFLKSVS
ncbi:hypothetical protein [Candidatus Nitrosotenuis cloacae]|uniref:hypothetical protein n=1 Tax=Candidatus Nitrosotenuis cloacae TaxID=1603555 RepID=UPI002280C4D9|nr:hypothetical protein [Candidatus Nitrosotenuis cloacae]